MLAQTVTYSYSTSGGLPGWFWPVYTIFLVVVIAGFWTTFVKAGHPGWGALIPFYNYYLLSKTAGRPGWWWVLLCIPIVNIVIWIIICIDVAKNFGKGGGFAVGLILLPYVFFLILGFGPAQYQGSPGAMGGGMSGGGMPPPPPAAPMPPAPPAPTA
jgi:hypothetical protein